MDLKAAIRMNLKFFFEGSNESFLQKDQEKFQGLKS